MLHQMSKYSGKCFGPSTRACKFLTQMHQLFIIKICYTIKVNSSCGVSRNTRSLCHKFSSQGPALRILGLRVAIPKFQEPRSRVLGVRAPCPRFPAPGSWVSECRVPGSQGHRFPGPRVLGHRCLSPRSQGLRVPSPGPQGPRSQVLVLEYA